MGASINRQLRAPLQGRGPNLGLHAKGSRARPGPRHLRKGLLVAVAALALASCSSGSNASTGFPKATASQTPADSLGAAASTDESSGLPSTTTSATPSAESTGPTLDTGAALCSIYDGIDLTSLLGQDPDVAAATTSPPPETPQPVDNVSCGAASTTAPLAIIAIVRTYSSSDQAKDVVERNAQLNNATVVPGLGDEAYLTTPTSQIIYFARTGSRYLVLQYNNTPTALSGGLASKFENDIAPKLIQRALG